VRGKDGDDFEVWRMGGWGRVEMSTN
jgi:hypothetical protein